MTQRNRTALKEFFKKGAIPTQENFADLIDSLLNQEDDAIVSSNGNIGIGTTNPGPYRLNVVGSALFTGNYLHVSSESVAPLRVGAAWSIPGIYSGDAGNNDLILGVPNGNKVHLGFGPGDAHIVGGSGDTYIKGNVGIGTDSPSAKLEVHLPTENSAENGTTNPPETVLRLSRAGRYNKSWDNIVDLRIGRYENSGTCSRTRLDIALNHGDNENPPQTTVMSLRSDGYVGIGTTSPSAKLEVNGTAKATSFEGNGASLQSLNASNITTGSLAVDRIPALPTSKITNLDTTLIAKAAKNGAATENFVANNLTANGTLTVSGTGNSSFTGNVGIGTTSPTAKLDVLQEARSGGGHPTAVKGLYVTGAFGPDSDGVEFRHSNGTQGIGFGYNTIYATGSNQNQDLGLKPRGAGKVIVNGGATFNGNVGIGTTDPKAPLQIHGNAGILNLEGNDHAFIQWFPNGIAAGRKAWIGFGDVGTKVLTIANDAGGHISINCNLKVDGGIGSAGGYWTIFDGKWQKIKQASSPGVWLWDINDALNFSDQRLKRNVEPITSALEKITSFSGVTYRWNEDGLKHFTRDIEENFSAGPQASAEENQKVWEAERKKRVEQLSGQQIGLIAQDVEPVVPELVNTDSEGYKSIDYGRMTALLVEAIKEQQALIGRLTARVSTLETRMAQFV